MSSKTLGKVVIFSAVFLLILAGPIRAAVNYPGTWKMENKTQNTLTIEALGAGKYKFTASGPLNSSGTVGSWTGYGYNLMVGTSISLIAAFTYSINDGGFVTFSEVTSTKIKFTSYSYQGVKRDEGYYIK